MSQAALKAAATGKEVAQSKPNKPKTIAGLLTDPTIKQQMALALPKHMTADRLARIALTEVRKVPKLAQCDQTSFLGAIMQCASLGLEPGGALGHAYLLPFDRRKKVGNQWKTVGTDVQLIIGYRGMIDLARRSGQIQSLEARAVYAEDEFHVEFGLDSNITHKPAWEKSERGPLVFVYAIAKLKDGGVQFDVMSRAEIEKVRAQSKAKDNGPWVSHFDEMAKKTVIRRLFKYLPVSIEIQRAVGLDEQAEAGLQQDNPLVIEGSYSEVETHEEAGQEGDTSDGADAGTDSPEPPPITAQEVHDALANAQDRDSLDVAGDLINMLPESERATLRQLYDKRALDIVGAET
ncbi:MAG TPA: recombination protein RecT [Rhodanobacteraceae bacterium]|nr:recombination protein RecT [Rhodanobacteraceae bacterium]